MTCQCFQLAVVLPLIITRSPLRLTLGGGGTDLPSYAHQFGGFCLTAAINQYVYVTVTRPFVPGIFLKYSQIEHVARVADVQHPLIRRALAQFGGPEPLQIEITTLADIPAGSGLGSSSSFTTALLKALAAFRQQPIPNDSLAAVACEIEADRPYVPTGKQDQYAAAFGGLSAITCRADDGVTVAPLSIAVDRLHDLEDHLLLFFTGYLRPSDPLLADQDRRTKAGDSAMIENLHAVKALARETHAVLLDGPLDAFGDCLHQQWLLKHDRSPGMIPPDVDRWYETARHSGAVGGKLVGAGGGGFLLFYASDPRRLREGLRADGLQEVRFRFDFEGTKVLLT